MKWCFGLLAMMMCVIQSGGVSTFCEEPEDHVVKDWSDGIRGHWEQVLTSKFIMSTDLIDQSCVNVNVSVEETPIKLIVHEHSIQHGYTNLVVNRTYSLTDPIFLNGQWYFQNKKHLPGYQLRCIKISKPGSNDDKDFVIWTGSDNLSLMVWARNSSYFTSTLLTNVTAFLKNIEYTGKYKTPVMTYNHTTCKHIKE